MFLILLACSGLILNHTTELSLERRYVEAPWLLEWYGFDVPPVARSYIRGDDYAALIGDRVYLNGQELLRGVTALRGLLQTGQTVTLATADELVIADRDGVLLDRLRIDAIDAIGLDSSGQLIVVRGGERWSAYRVDTLETQAAPSSGTIDWAEPSDLPNKIGAELELAYRGPGLSLERLIYDLHSGRVLGTSGKLLMDLVAIIAVALAISGLVLWLKPRA